MIYPIVIIGDPVLRKKAEDIDSKYPKLVELIEDMYTTMDNANGVGLAAPQIGKSIRLFVVDANPLAEDYPEENLDGFKKTFINAHIIERGGTDEKFEEGCLSIPGLRENILRKGEIRMKYQDENFNSYEETFSGIKSRIIQHEYDHIDGILFTDHLSPLKKSLIKSKLANISKGQFSASYKTRIKS